MPGNSTVSILLPVFNGCRYLPEQLQSVLDQTWHGFEFLVHDDGSSDKSADILKDLAARDTRVKWTSTSSNVGQRLVLRSLLAKARGQYIMFCDQDDVWHPDKIEVLLASIGDAAMCFGSSALIDRDGSAVGRTIFDHVGPPIDGRDNTDFLFRSVVSGHALLARREVVDPAVFLFGTEYDWLLAVLATFSRGVVHAPEAITYHRQHDGNQVNAFGAAKKRTTSRSKHWHRVMRLHDALSLLRASDQIADEKRAIFNRLSRALRDELMLAPRAPVFNARFAASFAQALDGLAVDAAHRARAIKAIDKICRGVLHPKSVRDALTGR
jgi:glycosyltransferase involved in cell wall biosynthesis